jgi:hypothetical protein
MQLGTRWSIGAEPPSRLSTGMLDAIRGVEAERRDPDTGGLDTSLWRWTLTWLEGNPVAELEDGTTVREDHDGSVVITVEGLDL